MHLYGRGDVRFIRAHCSGQELLSPLDAAPDDTECFRPQGSLQRYAPQGPRALVVSLFCGDVRFD